MIKIAIASDHAGFKLKEDLKNLSLQSLLDCHQIKVL